MFRDNFYAGRYLPIVITKEGKIGHGFSESNMIPGVSDSKKMNDLLNLVLPFSPTGEKELRKFGFQANDPSCVVIKIAEMLKNLDKNYIVLPVHHSLINEYLLAKHNTKINFFSDYTLQDLMKKSAYRTERVLLTLVMANDLLDILQKFENWKKYSGKEFCEILRMNSVTFSVQPSRKININLFVNKQVVLPIWQEWKNFLISWEQQSSRENNSEFDCFCKIYFQKENYNRKHQRVRNKFSLPMVTREGKFLQKRKNWTKEIDSTIQIANEADPRSGGNIYQIPVVTSEGNVEFGGLSSIYQSESIHRLIHKQEHEGLLVEYPTWFKLQLDEILSKEERKKYSKHGVVSIYLLVDNLTRPTIKVNLNKYPTLELFSLALLRPRENKDLKKKITDQVKTNATNHSVYTLIYKGASYPSGSLKFATKC